MSASWTISEFERSELYSVICKAFDRDPNRYNTALEIVQRFFPLPGGYFCNEKSWTCDECGQKICDDCDNGHNCKPQPPCASTTVSCWLVDRKLRAEIQADLAEKMCQLRPTEPTLAKLFADEQVDCWFPTETKTTSGQLVPGHGRLFH